MPKDLGIIGGVTREGFNTSIAPDTDEPSINEHSHRPRINRQIIDWPRAILLTFLSLFLLPLLITALANGDRLGNRIGLVVWILVTLAVVKSHFSGLVFDLDRDRLIFPTLLFRRSIRLSEIRDANAEYIHRSGKADAFDTPINPRGSKVTVQMPIYAANLSGEFGARQVKFWSKKRRDQFLGALREVVPGVHITRWI